MADLYKAAINSPHFQQSDVRRLVVIRNNVVTFPLMPPGLKQFECDEACNPQLIAFMEGMRAAVHVYGLKLPDVVFSLSGEIGGQLGARGD